MNESFAIQLFEGKKVRIVWDAEQEKCDFSVTDIVQVLGSMRVDQMIDPELTFQMAVEDYRRQGYSDRWINERMRSIEMRKELTDEWHRSGIHEPKDFAILTNVLTKAWSGMTTGEYKRHKGLTKQNRRTKQEQIPSLLGLCLARRRKSVA